MLSPEKKQRIEEEELYRAEIRKKLGPIRTTSFLNRLAKFIVWVFVAVLAISVIGGLSVLFTNPKI